MNNQYTSNIVCPWCGRIDQDSWDHHIDDGESIEIECETCLNLFNATMTMTIEYSTEKIKEKVNAI